jgi:hypothetical protein
VDELVEIGGWNIGLFCAGFKLCSLVFLHQHGVACKSCVQTSWEHTSVEFVRNLLRRGASPRFGDSMICIMIEDLYLEILLIS